MSKLKNSIFFLILLFSLIMLSGCSHSNYEENLENFYYVMAIGIDKSDKETINLSMQIASNSDSGDSSGQSSSSAQSSSSKIYTVPCNSINSGITILNNYLSKQLNLSHCAAIIFSEEIAKDGIKEYINTLGNNKEIRPTCNIIISNSTSLEALEQISNSTEAFSSKFYEFIQTTAEYTGYSLAPELSHVLYCLNYGFNSAIATYAYVSEDTIQNISIALFDNDKFIDTLSVLDSISYSLIINRLENSYVNIKNPKNLNQLIDISIKQTKKPKIECSLINNYPFIKIELNLKYNLLSSPQNLDTGNDKDITILENSINEYIEEMILNFLYKISHKYNADICNFENKLSAQYLTLDEYEKVHWKDIYKDSFFKVKINGKVENTGTFSKK